MKFITPLYSDPIGWTEWLAKTPVRIIIWIFVHIGFIYMGFSKISERINDGTYQNVSATDLFFDSFPITFIGIAYPALYFIAMYKLLKIIREKGK